MRNLSPEIINLGKKYFNYKWYCKKNSLNIDNETDAYDHYINIGRNKGYEPNEFFDSKRYLSKYKDVKKSKIDPFFHYVEYGISEGRHPNPECKSLWQLFYKFIFQKKNEINSCHINFSFKKKFFQEKISYFFSKKELYCYIPIKKPENLQEKILLFNKDIKFSII
ncbi:hypothetical protein, partial [Liquorilactobacillus sp.]|uniref:hypothetical protein n=1 Tax=Liquorilactobacillus sp. TaxID=2767923 RepID=UPI0039EB3A8B